MQFILNCRKCQKSQIIAVPNGHFVTKEITQGFGRHSFVVFLDSLCEWGCCVCLRVN